MIQLKRAYEPPAESDGMRVLIDRLWPRGLRKERARIDAWLKDIAPSDELRTWFGHDPSRFREFRRRYGRELRSSRARPLVEDLARRARALTVTLVYAARDEDHNNAVVLAEELKRRGARRRPRTQSKPRRVRGPVRR